MEKYVVDVNGVSIAVIKSDEPLIKSVQDTLDLLVTVLYNERCQRIALYEESITADFFKLSTGIAGEVLQKFVNFKMKLAIIGDFTAYTSQSFRDFMYECNRGNQVFFVQDEQSAIDRLAAAR